MLFITLIRRESGKRREEQGGEESEEDQTFKELYLGIIHINYNSDGDYVII